MKLYNPFKKHLVQLSTGNYGVRYYTMFGWKYVDLSGSGHYSWSKGDLYFPDCMTNDKEFAKLHLLTEKVL